jgi:predicted transcriptional regulator
MKGETEMIDRLLSSDVKADLLALFHNNPGLTDRIDGLARRIGRAASEIEADVKELIDLGALSKKRTGESEVIYCDRMNDMEIQQIVSNRLKRQDPST